MTVLFSAESRFGGHDTGRGHPERPARLDAAAHGVLDHHLGDMLLPLSGRDASDAELLAVHSRAHVRRLERFCELGGGNLDADTVVGPQSARLARRASGTVLAAIETLRNDIASAAFVAVRPPGHHATADRAMGFCLFNHVAVAAAAIVADGGKVAVVDIDAHHGNGTQDIFHDSGEVFYVSWHQSPHYPHSGAVDDIGADAGIGTTMNIPLPAGATGEHYRRSVSELVAPALEAFDPDWLLISAGFDAHRADPLCDLALSAGDVGDVVADVVSLVPRGRTVAVLEGGYSLDAVADCTAATVAALGGIRLHPEKPTSGGPGADFVEHAVQVRHRLLD